jgi:hypothetical protein
MDETDFNEPQLISMEGEELDLLGMENEDVEILGSDNMSVSEFNYLNSKYPELLGFYATAAAGGLKILKKFGSGFRKIAQRIKAKRAARKEGAAQAQVENQAEQVRQSQRAIQTSKNTAQGKNSMLIIGAIALILAGVILMKKKGKK